ncbi:MAG: hypothetical protein N3G19_03610, partial [Candidatus Pacearchaeota archaeon]|nr:hypothetical protein [Candidatus Pacearchaeota archaeon]
ESKLEYKIDIPPSRLHGLIKIGIELDDDPKKYGLIAKNLKDNLESKGVNIKKIADFLGKPLV